MEIKKLESADACAVLEIMERSFSVPWSLGTVETLISSENASCLGAFEDGVLIGYAFLEQVLDEGSLTDIAVHPEHRRKGVSAALMQMLMQKATSLNLAFVTLEVRVSNTPAVSLYRKFGFEDVGRRPAYYTLPTEDALLMTKKLG